MDSVPGLGQFQPLEPRQYWHIDFDCVNVGEMCYSLSVCLMEHPESRSRIISDDGPHSELSKAKENNQNQQRIE